MISLAPPCSAHSEIQLRDYHLEAIEAVNDAEVDGIRRPLVSLPTGTGKTIVFAQLINERPGWSLILAHRDELIRQAVDKLRLVNPEFDIGVVKAGENETSADVVVASVQTPARSNRLEQLYCNFNNVIVGEAHHATADTYQRILEHVGSFAENAPLTAGFTATPERSDKAGFGQVWERIVYQKNILEMILAGYLCDLKAVRVSISVNLDQVHVRGGDFVDSELGSALMDAKAPQHVVAAYQGHAAGRKALVFTPTVSMAYEMARAFNSAGIASEALDSTTSEEERRAILKRFHTGETMVLANCCLFIEGFDEPSIDCIISARPTKSRPFYQQMIGRGTRTHPGKEDCLILDVVGNSERHDLVTADSLFDMDLSSSGLSVKQETQRAADTRVEDDAGIVHDGPLVSSAVDLFKDREIHWQRTNQGAWILSLGANGMLRMVSEDSGDNWDVHLVKNGVSQVLREGLPLGYAQGFLEDFAKKLGWTPLLNPNASWRSQQATEKQKNMLRKWKVPVAPGITKGAASDLVAAIIGDR